MHKERTSIRPMRAAGRRWRPNWTGAAVALGGLAAVLAVVLPLASRAAASSSLGGIRHAEHPWRSRDAAVKTREQGEAKAPVPTRETSGATAGPLTKNELTAALQVARVVRPWRFL